MQLYVRRVARFFLAWHTKTGKIYQNTPKYIKWPQTIPTDINYRYQMAINYSKWSQNKPTFPWPSKIYPNWDFWFESKPSGNPGGIANR
jgi:hypothetical protein